MIRTWTVVAAAVLATGAAAFAQETGPAPAPSQDAASGRTVSVVVTGVVPRAGTFTLPAGSRLGDVLLLAGLRTPLEAPRNMSLVEAIAASNPCPADAELRQVFLTRGTGAARVSYSFDFTSAGRNPRANPILADDDRVFIPLCRRFKPIQLAEPQR